MMKLFKIRCSAISKIMAGQIGLTDTQTQKLAELSKRRDDHMNGVDKVKPLTSNMQDELAYLIHKRDNPDLPAGAKSYCEQWYLENKFNRRKEWYSNKIEKGLAVEPIAIEMLARHEGVKLVKNDEYFENDFIQGSPDVIYKPLNEEEEVVDDTKCSWDIFTFPWFDKVLPDEGYDWQMQGYFDLTGLKKGAINYCLIDTPAPIIQMELKKLYYQSGGVADEWTPEINMELAENFKFNDIPVEQRLRKFTVQRDDHKIKSIYERVIMCRKYIELLTKDVENAVDNELTQNNN